MPYACPVEPSTPRRVLGASLLARDATGPYRIAAMDEGRTLVLARNPSYDAGTLGPRGFAGRIEIALATAPARALGEIASGHAALMLDQPPPALWRAVHEGAYPGAQAFAAGASGEVHVLVMGRAAPPFRDAETRLAVAEALDRRAIVRAAGGAAAGVASDSLIPPSMPGYRRTSPPGADPRSARARLVLAGRRLPLRTTLYAARGADASTAPVVARQLAAAGIHARVVVLSRRALLGALRAAPQSLPLALVPVRAAYPDPQALFGPLLGPADSTTATLDLAAGDGRLRRALLVRARSQGDVRYDELFTLGERVGQRGGPVIPLWYANIRALASSGLTAPYTQPVYGLDLALLRAG
jgi:peptide/nickel transport system substrate-binding protein